MIKLNRTLTVLFHVGVWAALLFCVWLWRPMMRAQQLEWRPQLTASFILLTSVPAISLFYLNAYYLIPVYFTRKNRLPYFLLAVLAWVIAVALQHFAGDLTSPPPPGYHLLTF